MPKLAESWEVLAKLSTCVIEGRVGATDAVAIRLCRDEVESASRGKLLHEISAAYLLPSPEHEPRIPAKLYAKEPRVVFDIAAGNMFYIEVYGRKIRWTHGDDVRYFGGVGGITIPIRKAIDSWNLSIHAHLTCMGHWHQVTDARDFVVNGSLIGYTAYAQAIKARFEPAAQAFFLLDRRRGKRLFSPIQVQDTAGWS